MYSGPIAQQPPMIRAPMSTHCCAARAGPVLPDDLQGGGGILRQGVHHRHCDVSRVKVSQQGEFLYEPGREGTAVEEPDHAIVPEEATEADPDGQAGGHGRTDGRSRLLDVAHHLKCDEVHAGLGQQLGLLLIAFLELVGRGDSSPEAR